MAIARKERRERVPRATCGQNACGRKRRPSTMNDVCPVSLRPAAASAELVDFYTGFFAVYGYGNVDMVVWDNAPSLPAFDHLSCMIEARVQKYSRMCVIHVATSTVGLPAPEVHAGFATIGLRWWREIVCVAVVIEHEGFLASALRGLAMSVQQMVPRRFPLSVFQTVADAASWVSEAERPIDVAPFGKRQLLTALCEARMHHGERVPSAST